MQGETTRGRNMLGAAIIAVVLMTILILIAPAIRQYVVTSSADSGSQQVGLEEPSSTNNVTNVDMSVRGKFE